MVYLFPTVHAISLVIALGAYAVDFVHFLGGLGACFQDLHVKKVQVIV